MKKYFFILLCIPLFISSCMFFNTGSVSSGPLLNPTDKYVDHAFGKASSYLVLGLGATYGRKLVSEAMADLYRKRPLRNGEYYANISTEVVKKLFGGFFVQVSVVRVDADVLKSADSTSAPFTERYKQMAGIHERSKAQEAEKTAEVQKAVRIERKGFAIGDSVYYSFDAKNYSLFRISQMDKENVMLKAINARDKNMLMPLSDAYFGNNKEVDGFKKGDMVTVQSSNVSTTSAYEEGQVIGADPDLGLILVKTANGYSAQPATRLKHK